MITCLKNQAILYERSTVTIDKSCLDQEPGFDCDVYRLLKRMRFKYGGSLQNKLDKLMPWGMFAEPNDKKFRIAAENEKQQMEQHIVEIYFVKLVQGNYQVCVDYLISNDASA